MNIVKSVKKRNICQRLLVLLPTKNLKNPAHFISKRPKELLRPLMCLITSQHVTKADKPQEIATETYLLVQVHLRMSVGGQLAQSLYLLVVFSSIPASQGLHCQLSQNRREVALLQKTCAVTWCCWTQLVHYVFMLECLSLDVQACKDDTKNPPVSAHAHSIACCHLIARVKLSFRARERDIERQRGVHLSRNFNVLRWVGCEPVSLMLMLVDAHFEHYFPMTLDQCGYYCRNSG